MMIRHSSPPKSSWLASKGSDEAFVRTARLKQAIGKQPVAISGVPAVVAAHAALGTQSPWVGAYDGATRVCD
jgi:hypothetical protein